MTCFTGFFAGKIVNLQKEIKIIIIKKKKSQTEKTKIILKS